MATIPRVTPRSSSFAGTRTEDYNSYFGYPLRTAHRITLTQSTTNLSTSRIQHGENVCPAAPASASSQSLPPSPLDNISSELYMHFPRFSLTTEASQPELSIEEVTSTRFSVDEEGIITVPWTNCPDQQNPKRASRIRRTIRKALSHQTIFLKRATLGVQRGPSSWGPISKLKDSDGQTPVLLHDESEQDLIPETAPILPAIPRQFSELEWKPRAQDDPFVYHGDVRENIYRPVSKLSALEEHRTSFDNSQETPRPATSFTTKQKREPVTHFPPNTMRYKFPPSTFTPHASTTTVNSYHTAHERRPLRRPSPLVRRSCEMSQSTSSGSLNDNRFYTFPFPPERMCSSSNLSSRHNSMVSLGQTAASQPYYSHPRPVSARSDGHGASALQKKPLFVEMSSQIRADINFLFPSELDASLSRISVSSQPHSRATSIHSFRSNLEKSVIIRSASATNSSHMDRNHRKVPLFVPARIERYSLAGRDEQIQLGCRRNSARGMSNGVADSNDGRANSELSHWSMTYQDGVVGRVSIDLASDSATIRAQKHGSLKEILNHLASKTSVRNRTNEGKGPVNGVLPRQRNFAKGRGSCIRRLSRALKGRQEDILTSSNSRI